MTARQVIVPGAQPSRDANGRVLPGKFRFYAPGTTTPKSVYTASDLSTPHPFPLLSDSAGRWPSIWADDAQFYDVGWSDQVFDETIKTYANVSTANDAVLASVSMSSGSADAAASSATAAANSAAASAISAANAQAVGDAFGDLGAAVTSAQTSATASATSASAAAASAAAAAATASGIDLTPYAPKTRALNVGGLVTGGGDLTANRTFTVTAATATDVRVGLDNTKALTALALASAAVPQTLTDASTIAWNASQGFNAVVTLTASGHTIGAPSNLLSGITYNLEIVQGTGGSFTVNWNAIWDFGAAGLPTLQTGATKSDEVFAKYNARTGKLVASFRLGA